MSDLFPTLQSLIDDAEARRPVAICTIVETRGSTPQCPGATMLVRADGKTVGTLGGGCVEAEVRRRALEFIQQGHNALLDYVLDHDFGWDDGLVCGGKMKVAVMPLVAGCDLDPWRVALEKTRRREPSAFPIDVDHEGVRQRYLVHLEVPPTLLIAGAGHVGKAVAKLAVDLDFHVVVIDDRGDYAASLRFDPRVELVVADIPQTLREHPLDAGTYVVIVTRGHQHDEQALEAVVRREAAYIGLIGSRRKSRLIFADLKALGVTDAQLARVHTPIGLDIRAITVPEIAVSIMAQLVKVRREQVPVLVEGPFAAAQAAESSASRK